MIRLHRTALVLLAVGSGLGFVPRAVAEPSVSTFADGFNGSGGVTVDVAGNIYVGDFGSGPADGSTIVRITPDGSSSVFATGIPGATGGRFDSEGNLYWSGYAANMVYRIDGSGAVSPFASIPGPVAIAIDDADNLYVASYNSNTIRRVTPEGVVSTFASSFFFNGINGLTRGDAGEFYACNFDDGRILRISSTGGVSSLAVLPGGNAVNLAFLDGMIYVTARSEHRIYAMTPTGVLSPFSGTGARGGADGPAATATHSLPNSIGVDPSGTCLYVNDVDPGSSTFHPNTLRKIDLAGPVSIESMSFGKLKAAFR